MKKYKFVGEIKVPKVFPYLILLVALILSFTFLKENSSAFHKILEINLFEFIILSSLFIISLVTNGLKTKLLVEKFSIDLSAFEGFGLAAVTAFWNYLPLSGGLAARAAYLKGKHKFPLNRFIVITLASYLVSFFAFGVVGLAGVLFLWMVKNSFSVYLLFIVGLLMIGPIVLFKFLPNLKLNFNLLEQLSLGWFELVRDKKLLGLLFLTDMAYIFVEAARLYLTAVYLNLNVSFLVFLITSGSVFFTVTSLRGRYPSTDECG